MPVDSPANEILSHPPAWLTKVRESRWLYPALIALIILTSLVTSTARRYLNFDNPSTDIARMKQVDVDYHMLYPSIEAKQTFVQTFNWWREPWRADQWVGAYWRPLTMQAWWLQAHVFGEDKSSNWMRVSVALQVLFDVLLALFLQTLTNRRLIALLGLAIFALPPVWWHMLTPLAAAPRVTNADLMITQGWKDQPDLWGNCFILASLILALRNKYGWALLCTAIAIGFKESGLLCFPLIALLLLGRGELRKVPWTIYAGSAAILVAMMFCRYLAGPLVFHFHSYGRDVSGPTRYAFAVLPLALTSLALAGEALLGLAIFWLILARPKRLLIWLVWIVVFLWFATLLIVWQDRTTVDVAFAELVDPGYGPIILFVLWLLITAALIKTRTYLRPAILFMIAGAISALPFAMATQAAVHTLALTAAFQAGYCACLVLALIAFLERRVARNR